MEDFIFKSGGIIREKDKRDINLGAVQVVSDIPKEYLPDISWIKRNFQGQIPACSAHAGTHLKCIQEKKETGEPQRFTPRFSWIQIKKIDNFPLEEGTDMRSLLKSLATDGVCDYDLLENDIKLPLTIYSDSNLITESMKDNAKPRIVASYAFLNEANSKDIEAVKRAIYNYGVVVILSRVGPGFFHTKTPKDTETPWGHFFVGTGYTENAIRVLDSADPSDEMAEKFLDAEYVRHFDEVGTTVDLPNSVVPGLKSKIVILKKIVELYTQILLLMRSK